MPTPSLPPAGVVPTDVSVALTGDPVADATFAYAQILAALDRSIAPTLRPGASVTYGTVTPWPLPALVLGTATAVNVAATISGDDDAAPVSGVTTVTIDSVAAPAFQPKVLFLSDDPEYLNRSGLVFQGEVSRARPARLYYYHSNIGVPRDLDVILTAAVPTRVHLIASSSGPDADVMSVGHAVTRDFLQNQRTNEGILIDLVPNRPFVVRHALLLQGELVAGNLDTAVLGGGPATISIVATGAGESATAFLAGPRVYRDGHHRHGTFDLAAFGSISATYVVGGPPAVAQIGSRHASAPNVDPLDDGRDYGDYGIVRTLTFALSNPTAEAHKLYLYEEPLAGSVSSSFIVDGHFVQLDCVRSRQPYTVMTYELPPHSAGQTTTITMPDGGSYYPIDFGVTDVAPTPYTPLDGTADSCRPGPTPAPTPVVTPEPSESPATPWPTGTPAAP